MAGEWEWDESLFAGAAAYYERGRLPYAPGLADAVAALLPRGHGDRLLDVGCGPGTLSLRLVGVFDSLTAIDPDPGMIAEARQRAAGARNVEFVQARAEELPLGLGMFDAAAFGQSFHWMRRDQVAATIHGMLNSGGLFLQVSDLKNATPRDRTAIPDPAPPYEPIRSLVREHLGPVRRAGRSFLPDGTPGDEVAVLARHGFAGPDRITVPAGQVLLRSTDDVISWVYSRSDSAPGLFGDGLAAFDAELRALLMASSPSGRFAEHVPDTELIAWRKP
jgi:SAM-dependent methyltransferase